MDNEEEDTKGHPMTKDTFTAALKRAQTLSGAYPIDEEQRDIFYDALKGELDEDILHALDRIGKSGEKITYSMIAFHIGQCKDKRFEAEDRNADDGKVFVPMPPETKEAFGRLFGKNWNKP